MSDAPRFEHSRLPSGEHCVTSPDVKGLCAIAGTEADARREADKLLALFKRRGIPIRPRTGHLQHEHA